LPVGYTADLFDALSIQDELQTLYTSGTVFHAFLGEKLPDWQSAAALVRKIAENFKLPYYTLSPTYSICAEHGYIAGEHFTCPKCGKNAEVYSRITGYYRPVQNWNDGKTQEYKDRKLYDPGMSHLESSRPDGRARSEALPASTNSPLSSVEPDSTAQAMRDAVEELFLFTTKTCPNCKTAKEELEKAGLLYTIMDVSEHLDLVRKYRIMQAPTLLVRRGSQVELVTSAPSITKYAAAL